MITKFILASNKSLNGKRFRLFIGLFSTISGIIRLGLLPGATFTKITFGDNTMFGLLFMIFGILLVITSFNGWRFKWYGKFVSTIMAVICGTIGVSIIPMNSASAVSNILMSLFLLSETIMVYEY